VKRALLGILGVIVLLGGCCLLAVSAWVYAAFGSDGIASTSLGELASKPTSRALVIDVDEARVSIPVIPVQGVTTMRLQSSDGTELVAGSASRIDADTYTVTREIDVASRVGDSWELTHVPGISDPTAPQAAPSWMTTGSEVSVEIEANQTVVIANADGSPGVGVSASLQYSAPQAPLAGLALSISGGVLVLAGIALCVSSLWIMRRRTNAAVE
jgi:hypothetical protein